MEIHIPVRSKIRNSTSHLLTPVIFNHLLGELVLGVLVGLGICFGFGLGFVFFFGRGVKFDYCLGLTLVSF